jgi:hypothetical protein
MKKIFRNLKPSKILILLVIGWWGSESNAQGLFDFYSRAKIGFTFETLSVDRKVLSGEQGLIMGFRYSRYLGKSLNLGVGLDAGLPTYGQLATTNLQKLGLMLGYDAPLFGSLVYDLNFLAGYAYGESKYYSKNGQGLFAQPMGGIGVKIIKGVRALGQVGYFHMPNFPVVSGWVIGAKLEYKLDLYEDSAGVND